MGDVAALGFDPFAAKTQTGKILWKSLKNDQGLYHDRKLSPNIVAYKLKE